MVNLSAIAATLSAVAMAVVYVVEFFRAKTLNKVVKNRPQKDVGWNRYRSTFIASLIF